MKMINVLNIRRPFLGSARRPENSGEDTVNGFAFREKVAEYCRIIGKNFHAGRIEKTLLGEHGHEAELVIDQLLAIAQQADDYILRALFVMEIRPGDLENEFRQYMFRNGLDCAEYNAQDFLALNPIMQRAIVKGIIDQASEIAPFPVSTANL